MKFAEIKDHLAKFTVGIAGAGGLGSNCAVALARSGIGTLVICDYDKIEELNLNRQYYFTDQVGQLKVVALKENIMRLNSGVHVVIHRERLENRNIPVIFTGCDVIVEAFDNAEMKEMLIETVHLKMPGIPLIVASGVAGWGNNETIKCRKIDNTLYVCGDESTETSPEMPAMAPRVGIVAGMQANIVVEILMKKALLK